MHTLTKDQEKAAHEISKSINAKKDHVLMGYAGTGKTFLCNHLLETLGKTALCSPTNKAARVITEMTGFPATTIHQMLKLRLDKGKLIQYARPDFSSYDAVIVDECSMLNGYIHMLLKKYIGNTPILFIGDPAQLPPVKENGLSVSFDTPNKSMLTEIVRQKAGSPIIQFGKTIREKGFTGEAVPYDGKNIVKLPPNKVMDLAIQAYKTGGIVAGWRNATCDFVNYGVHDILYGPAMDFNPGEEIILQEPLVNYMRDKEILANNGDFLTVKEIRAEDVTEKSIEDGETRFKAWKITTTDNYNFSMIHRSDKNRYNAFCKNLLDRKQEHRFYALKERIVEIKHTYAMTCHKLQGSTYKKVLIVLDDIMANGDKFIRDRCAYVAVTRASEKIAFLAN